MAQEVRAVRSRRAASLVLAVVGTVFLFIGGIALYAREEVFDADSFAQHASESLGDERVDTAVANPIVTPTYQRRAAGRSRKRIG